MILPPGARIWIVAPSTLRQKVRVIKGVAKNFIVPDDMLLQRREEKGKKKKKKEIERKEKKRKRE